MASFNANDHRLVARQHIQDHGEANVDYWGYASRVLPCTSDPGSCEYLDAVYGMHSISMLYTFIMWLVIGAMLVIYALLRIFRPQRREGQSTKQSFFYRLRRGFKSAITRHLLPESLPKLFPYTTRLQVLVLAALCVYLTVFSFVGIVYKTWVTPVKDTPYYNTRSGLGGFNDRVGAFAFALTPLTVGLCSRDSVLSLLTGIHYQNFNFLHRWTGRIILVQSFIHTIGWTIIEAKLYQPQPKVYTKFITQEYMIWGIIAQSLLTFLWVFSMRPVIRWTGYEFFRKSHFIVAVLYLVACWHHWEKLKCWMIASFIILGLDVMMRWVRVFLIHFGYKDGQKGLGFHTIQATTEIFKDPSGTILRMTFSHYRAPWQIGQHFYLTFPSMNVWQSHPFTVGSCPSTDQTYIIRARDGETGRLAALADATRNEDNCAQIPVILTGPYGGNIVDDEVSNIFAIAGGTGVTFPLPVVMNALEHESSSAKNIELVWVIRHVENLQWIGPELAKLKTYLDNSISDSEDKWEKTGKVTIKPSKRLRIRIFVTRSSPNRAQPRPLFSAKSDKDFGDSDTASVSSATSLDLEELLRPHPNFTVTYLNGERPNVFYMLDSFINDTVSGGRTQVIGSGPPELGTEIRSACAAKNSIGGVLKGDETGDIDCVWDDRMG